MSFLQLRNRHFFILDALLLALTPTIALALRVETTGFARFAPGLLSFTLFALAIKLPIFFRVELYRRYWRYASIAELVNIVVAVGLASTAISVVFLITEAFDLFGGFGLPRSIPFIDAMITLMVVSAPRLATRVLARQWTPRHAEGRKRILIAGAGDSGSSMAREMRASLRAELEPVGFVDDDPHKQGISIYDTPVLGKLADLPGLIQKHAIDEVIIAMPAAPGKVIREVVQACDAVGVPSRTLPAISELLSGQVSVSRLRSIRIEDLLRREPIQVDLQGITGMFASRRVLVTGAGGSIGSELCRQIIRCQPEQLILLGHGENSLFAISHELARLRSGGLAFNSKIVVADVRDRARLKSIFERERPHLVLHAAAHKHVPMMEANVEEAVTTNVLGTRNVVELCEAFGVERFVLISSDKAVNPVSIMGASKRAAERVVGEVARRSGRPYVSVRFGNVLGSRGSAVPLFQQQISLGGPVTVTHPEMKRYFMTIPEAVQLVLQAALLSANGKTFILDMGEPIKIVDLVQDLIRLSGLQVGRDIDIVFTGLRPGEKLFEELFLDGEAYDRTAHNYIFAIRNGHPAPAALLEQVNSLIAAAQRGQPDEVRRWLKTIVPEYNPDETPVGAPSPAASALDVQKLERRIGTQINVDCR